MLTRMQLKRALFGIDVAVAFTVLAFLYLVRFVRFQPLQIPAYLLIVAYDLVEVVVPVLGPYHQIVFPVFLYLLAIVGAAVARRFRVDSDGEESLVRSLGGVCLVIGTISLLFGVAVGGPLIAPTDNPTPLAITGATGVILLLVGFWLLRGSVRRVGLPS